MLRSVLTRSSAFGLVLGLLVAPVQAAVVDWSLDGFLFDSLDFFRLSEVSGHFTMNDETGYVTDASIQTSVSTFSIWSQTTDRTGYTTLVLTDGGNGRLTLDIFGLDSLSATANLYEEFTFGNALGNYRFGAADLVGVTQPVPLPGGLPLMAAGLLGLAWMRRRQV